MARIQQRIEPQLNQQIDIQALLAEIARGRTNTAPGSPIPGNVPVTLNTNAAGQIVPSPTPAAK